ERAHPRAAQASRGLGAVARRAARRNPARVSHRVGAADALADRHGGRPRRVHRSESVAKSDGGESEHRTAIEHVHVRVEARAQEHLLPALAAGDADREDHGRLLAREPRILRGMPVSLLEPGLNLTLRPMAYPQFFEMYRAAIKNTWTVEEVDFGTDLADLAKMTPAERHLIQRLVAFFATGESIVANNLVLNLYKHINAPEARMYLSRQLYEEALHVQFYLTLLDTYVPDHAERQKAFSAVETIPSIKQKAAFCMKWIDSIQKLDRLETAADRRQFLLNLICFAACIEGLFFFGAFAYVYFLRSKGLLHGLAGGTNWVFRDESAHMAFAFEVVATVRREEPELFDA